jgi:hypothetical protein
VTPEIRQELLTRACEIRFAATKIEICTSTVELVPLISEAAGCLIHLNSLLEKWQGLENVVYDSKLHYGGVNEGGAL